MAHLDNPAGRLHRLMVRLRTQAGGQISVETAWKVALADMSEVDKVEGIDLVIGIHAAAGLLAEIAAELTALEVETDVSTYRSYIPRWGRFVGMQPHPRGAGFSVGDVASDDELAMLESLSNLLHFRGVEPKVNAERLASLLTSVQQLVTDLSEADDLDSDFRVFLMGHLRRAEDALYFIKVHGPGRLDEVYGRFFSESIREPEKWVPHQNTTFWTRARDLLNALPFVSARMGDVVQISDHAQKLLELGSSVPPPT